MPADIIAVTGHRPDKLGGYAASVSERLRDLARGYLHSHQPQKVLTGMALGWDTAVAEACLLEGIPFVAVTPFLGQEDKWPPDQQRQYQRLMREAVRVHCTDQDHESGYAPWKFQVRNMWMVDHSDRICALWNGSRGGTANCVKYAKKLGRPVDNIWEQWSR